MFNEFIPLYAWLIICIHAKVHANKFWHVRSLYARMLVLIIMHTSSAYTRALLKSFNVTDLASTCMLARVQNEKCVVLSTCHTRVLPSLN